MTWPSRRAEKILARLSLILVVVLTTGAPIVGACQTPRQAENTLDLSEYIAELQQWLRDLSRLDAEPAQAGVLRSAVPHKWPVRVGDSNIEVSTGWLQSGLAELEERAEGNESVRTNLVKQVSATLEEALSLRDLQETVEIAEAEIRLREILGREEFGGVHGPTWFDRLRQQLTTWFLDVVRRLFGKVGTYPEAQQIIVWVLVAILLIALALWVKRTVARASASVWLELKPESAAPAARNWRDWAREAGAAARAGRYREAIHNAYWAVVYRLAERGLWEVDETRTHREYLRLVAAGHSSHPPLASLTQHFERTWYGGRAATAEDFNEVAAEVEQLGCLLYRIPATEKS